MGRQNATAVAITGGTITGITDLAVADGGSGASTALGARQNFGLAVPGSNTQIGTWTENADGVSAVSASGGGAFSHQVVYWTAPATPYYIGMEWRAQLGSVNTTGGLWFRRSSTGRVVTLSMSGDGGLHAFRWTNITTFSLDASSTTLTAFTNSPNMGLVVYNDGTTLTLYQSSGASVRSGISKLTETIATFLGGAPDQVGVYYDAYDAASNVNIMRVVFS